MLTILETLPLEEGQRVINVNLDAASSDADERLIRLRRHHYRRPRAPGLAEGTQIDPIGDRTFLAEELFAAAATPQPVAVVDFHVSDSLRQAKCFAPPPR